MPSPWFEGPAAVHMYYPYSVSSDVRNKQEGVQVSDTEKPESRIGAEIGFVGLRVEWVKDVETGILI